MRYYCQGCFEKSYITAELSKTMNMALPKPLNLIMKFNYKIPNSYSAM